MDNLGDFEILYPLVDEKGNIIGKNSKDYMPTTWENSQNYFKIKRCSKDSTGDGSK